MTCALVQSKQFLPGFWYRNNRTGDFDAEIFATVTVQNEGHSPPSPEGAWAVHELV